MNKNQIRWDRDLKSGRWMRDGLWRRLKEQTSFQLHVEMNKKILNETLPYSFHHLFPYRNE
jgi:hypothetical protein